MKTKIKWKQTTSKKKVCSECGKNLFGQVGFINIKVELERDFWSNFREDNLCINCFDKLLKEVNEQRGTAQERKDKFNLLLKRRMLINLKK